MLHRRFSPCLFAGLLAAILPAVSPAQSKRPLSHKDYDGWRTITSQHLSNDGKFLAYGVFPQEGDGEVVVRNLDTGHETRFPAGARPAPGRRRRTRKDGAPGARRDHRVLRRQQDAGLFHLPLQGRHRQGEEGKKNAEQMPKDGMVIVELASGRRDQSSACGASHLPEKAAGYLAYLGKPRRTPRRREGASRHEGNR